MKSIKQRKLRFIPLKVKINDIFSFDCDDIDLNSFLKEDALNYENECVTKTFLVYLRNINELIGYVSLVNDSIKLKDSHPRSFRKRQKKKFRNSQRLLNISYVCSFKNKVFMISGVIMTEKIGSKSNSMTPKQFASYALDNPILFVVGAGISISPPSNLCSSRNIVESCINYLIDGDSNNSEIKALISNNSYKNLSDIFPEELFQILTEHTDHSILNIWKILDNKDSKPNINHKALVYLSNLHQVPIITVNFDTLIEQAVEEHKFKIIEDKFTELSKKEAGLWKIHGTISNINSIAMTVQSTHMKSEALVRGINRILAGEQPIDICFVGYSGKDGDLLPYLITSAKKNIFWIDKEFKDDHIAKLIPRLHLNEKKIVALEYEFDKISTLLLDKSPIKEKKLSSNEFIKAYIAKVFSKLEKKIDYTDRLLILGHLLQTAHDIPTSNKCLELFIQTKPTNKKKLFRAYLLSAHNNFMLSDYIKFVKLSKKALDYVNTLDEFIEGLSVLIFAYRMYYIANLGYKDKNLFFHINIYKGSIIWAIGSAIITTLFITTYFFRKVMSYLGNLRKSKKMDKTQFILKNQQLIFPFLEHLKENFTIIMGVLKRTPLDSKCPLISKQIYKTLIWLVLSQNRYFGDGKGIALNYDFIQSYTDEEGMFKDDVIMCKTLSTYLHSLSVKALPHFYTAHRHLVENRKTECVEEFRQCIAELEKNNVKYGYIEKSLLLKSTIGLYNCDDLKQEDFDKINALDLVLSPAYSHRINQFMKEAQNYLKEKKSAI